MTGRHAIPPLVGLLIVAVLGGCAAPSRSPAAGHIEADERVGDAGTGGEAERAAIPEPVTGAPSVPPPSAPAGGERYTVVVDDVPVKELLFAIARDADLNIDLAGDIKGRVTLNAVDATLPRLLERIAFQAPIRYGLEGDYLRIAADEPYVKTYAVPYVNLRRSARSRVDTATQIAATGFGDAMEDDGGQGGGRAGGNNSSTHVTNESDHELWRVLASNLGGLLGVDVTEQGEEPKGQRFVMVNREAGYITVRATQRQHHKVADYLDKMVESARRQVLIEATVVEVELDERFQAGIDWEFVSNSVGGLDLLQSNLIAGDLGQPPNVVAEAADPGFNGGTLRATLRALETFGDAKVVSSPKIMALNNQLAVLKVVDNRVFFTLEVETTTTGEGLQDETFETEVNTVPVGLVMTVTPYIGADDEVLLNVRPTVSRILGFRQDPNPAFADAGVTSEIPEIQVREMESLLRVSSGQVAMIGGLMQDTVDDEQRQVPGLGDLPGVGRLFRFRDKQVTKTELVIFLRPTVVDQANLEGDFRRYRQFLPRDGADGSGRPRGRAGEPR